MTMFSIDTYAVIGNPIDHSLSPAIHHYFATQTQQIISYQKIKAPLDQFAPIVNHFFLRGGKGLNITLPFKAKAWHLVTHLSERAKNSNAINTIKLADDGTLSGDNTDGIGLLNDLIINKHFNPAHKRILILGSGGAASGILPALISTKPFSMTMANRNLDKAAKIQKQFALHYDLQITAYEDLQTSFDLILNTTSASLQNQSLPLHPGILTANCYCYDLVYGVANNLFLNWARQHGVNNCFDGWGMLVEQAAEAFHWWRGVRPVTKELVFNPKLIIQ